MKELWIEIDPNASAQEKESLLSLAHENADVILEGDQASNRNGKLEIVFLTDLNEKKIAQLKKEGKKTALTSYHSRQRRREQSRQSRRPWR